MPFGVCLMVMGPVPYWSLTDMRTLGCVVHHTYINRPGCTHKYGARYVPCTIPRYSGTIPRYIIYGAVWYKIAKYMGTWAWVQQYSTAGTI